MDDKKPIRFATEVSASDEVRLTKEIEEDATIESLSIRFYQGPELAVQVVPKKIPDNGDGRPQVLVDLEGKEYIDGDGDLWEFNLSEKVEEGDVLEVDIENTAPDDTSEELAYDITVDMALDRHGGVLRPIRAVTERLTGVF